MKTKIFSCALLIVLFAFETAYCQQLDQSGILRKIKAHKKAVLVKDDFWIRDPYIILGPDEYYYLTGTTQMPGLKFDERTKYNVGLGDSSLVGWKMRVWKSKDLVNWDDTGEPFDLTAGYWANLQPAAFTSVPKYRWHLWAPELHFIDGKWIFLHTTPGPVRGGANFGVSKGNELQKPFDFPLADLFRNKHDPSLLQDTNGKVYLIYGNTQIVELSRDLTGFVGKPEPIHPTTLREMPNGKKEAGIGHEGAAIKKIGGKYVQFGTGWSTNSGRKGSYNLYYAVADNAKGPYGPRQFAGRFLGHGTPFKDKEGRWWCTAFFNANVPPVSKDGIRTRDLSETAQTINQQGLTLVPLDVKILKNGDVKIRALDPDYAFPGPDEVQKF